MKKTYVCPVCKEEQTEIKAYFEHYYRIDVSGEEPHVKNSEVIGEQLLDAECPGCSSSLYDPKRNDSFLDLEENNWLYMDVMNCA